MEIITLPDGRTLAYEEFGAPDGPTVVFCHGTPGSRRSGAVFDDLPVRIVAPDRPGIGGSDPDPGRTLDSWRADVTALVDALDLGSVGVLGFSAGGSFALAAGRTPAVERIGLLAPVGPPETGPTDALGFLGRHAPVLLRLLFAVQRPLVRRRPELALSALTDADPSSLSVPETVDPIELFADDVLTASDRGSKWLARELALLSESWSIPEPEVPVGVWYGRDDGNVPPVMAEAVAEAVGADVTALPTDHLETLCEAREACTSFVSPSA